MYLKSWLMQFLLVKVQETLRRIFETTYNTVKRAVIKITNVSA